MTDRPPLRPRRSCLYIPGDNRRALSKAKSLAADVLILDLEDAVAPETKKEARCTILDAINEYSYGRREVIIRINGLSTPWGHEDLRAAVSAETDGILLPKVVSGEQVLEIDAALSDAGASSDLGLWVMIERPLAILNIQGIAAVAAETRLTGLVMGTNDLAKELHATPKADRHPLQVPLAFALAAARAYGLAAIDGVYNDIENEKGLLSECQQGRALGFDGKTLIHPAQIEPTNRIFSPDPADVTHATEVIDAFAKADNQGKGVIKVKGKMVELLHLEQAERLIMIHNAILGDQQADVHE